MARTACSRRRATGNILLAALLAAPAAAAGEGEPPAAGAEKASAKELANLSIEELMDIEVTSVSKKPERLLDAPAAVYVITAEDIRQSGARSIPEVLRMVPGLDVAQIDSNKWAISSRGFNGKYATKLLVLLDGRSVYNHEFAGVYWDIQDTFLEDIERIEVVRGPGGTLWGANAVNGVINIITKSAKETQGGLAYGGAGSLERGFVGGRYGAALGEDTFLRAYAKYSDRAAFVDPDGRRLDDSWYTIREGFRLDTANRSGDSLRVEGDFFYGELGNNVLFPSLTDPFVELSTQKTRTYGGDLIGAWTHTISDTSNFTLQTYYDGWRRAEPYYIVENNAFDVDFQHRFALGARNDILWGLNYRVNLDDIGSGTSVVVVKTTETFNLVGGFIQDTVKLVPDVLSLTAGTKLDHNDYTGVEVQPSARLLFTPHPRHTFWGAVSRAVRTPSRGERDAEISTTTIPPAPPFVPLPTQVLMQGNRDFKSEDLVAFELGYRTKATERLSFDVAGFFNLYDNLRTTEPGAPFVAAGLPPHLVMPLTLDNRMWGKTCGVEAASDWQVTKFWKLKGAFTFLDMDLHRMKSSTDPLAAKGEDESPRYQASLGSHLDLPEHFEFDTHLYYVDGIRLGGVTKIPGYFRLDLRLAWKPVDKVELSVVFQNLLDDRHPEFMSEAFDRQAEVPRSVFAMVEVRF